MLYWSIMLSHGDFSRVKKFNVKRDVSTKFSVSTNLAEARVFEDPQYIDLDSVVDMLCTF